MKKNNGSNENQNGLIGKWGNDLFDDGIMNLPECVGKYAIRFVTPGEFVFIVEVFSYQYTRDLPFPSQQAIAENMGIGVRQIQKYVNSLEAKGLLKVYYRTINGKRTSNKYSFEPLMNKCLEISLAYKSKDEEEKNIKETLKKPTRTRRSGRNLPEPEGRVEPTPEGRVEPTPEGRVEPTPEGRPNKESEESNLEEGNLNNVCVDNNHRNELIRLIDSRDDLKPHAHTLLNIFDKKSSSKNFKADVFFKTLEIVDVEIFGINYLKTALQNNLKRGTVHSFASGDKKSKKPIRTEPIPERMKAEVEIPEQKAVYIEPNLNPNETTEEKMKRLLAEQQKFKTKAIGE